MATLKETSELILKAASKLEKMADESYFKRPINAVGIYQEYLMVGLRAIKFFQGVEGKPDKRLDAAWLAAGGDPKMLEPPHRPGDAAPSQVLNPLWADTMESIGLKSDSPINDILATLEEKSKSPMWSRFRRKAIALKNSSEAAMKAYKG